MNSHSCRHRGAVQAIAIQDDTLVSGAMDSTLRAWSISSGQEQRVYELEGDVPLCMAFVGKYVFVGCQSGELRMWDPTTGAGFRNPAHTSPCTALVSLGDSAGVVSGDASGRRCRWKCQTYGENRVWTVQGHRHEVRKLCILERATTSTDLQWRCVVISAGEDGLVCSWCGSSGIRIQQFQHGSSVLDFCQVGHAWLAAACRGGSICVWELSDQRGDPASGGLYRELMGHREAVTCLCALSEDQIVSGSLDFTLRVWSVDLGCQIKMCTGHTGAITRLLRLDDSSSSSAPVAAVWFVSAGIDGCVKLWPARESGVVSLSKHEGVVDVLHQSKGRLITGARDRLVKITPVAGQDGMPRPLDGTATPPVALPGLARYAHS